jgi:hypothetical protein
MATPLKYDLAIVGEAAIKRALRGIEASFAQHNARMSRAAGMSGVAGGGRGGPYRTAAPGGLARRNVRDVMGGFDQIGRAARAAHYKDGRERLRAEQQSNRRIERERMAHAKRLAAAEARAARQTAMVRERYSRATLGTAARSVGGSIRAVGGLAAMGLGIGGGMAVAGAINTEKRLRASSAALANQAYGTPGERRSREQIQQAVERQARSIGISSGLGTENVIGGLRNFVSIAGNVGAGQQLAPFMADMANATDADVGDVGRTAGQIFQNIATKVDVSSAEGMNDALEQTQEIMRAMGGQAKVGSIEFKDLATQMGAVMSATSGFDGKVSDLATTMGAVAQLAIAGGAKSPEEAMTAIMRFRDDLTQNAGRFEKMGVDVFTDESKTRMRAPEQVILDTLDATGGDMTKIGKLFGTRAKKAFEPFQEASVKAGGGKVGIEAVRKMLGGVQGATMSKEEIQESAAFRRGQSDRQFETAMAKFNDAIGKELLPTVTKLIPKFVELLPTLTKAAEAFGKFVEALAENPISTIGKLIAVKVAADLAMAGIGAAVKGQLVKIIAGSSVPGIGGAGGAAGKAGALGGAPVLPALAATAGVALAMDQGDKLAAEVGSKHRLSDLLPGMKGGEGSMDQLLVDANPVAYYKKIFGATSGLTRDTGMAVLEAGNMGPAKASKATGAQGQLGGGKTVAPPELPAAWESVPAKLNAAADKLALIGGPNRGTTPSPVK